MGHSMNQIHHGEPPKHSTLGWVLEERQGLENREPLIWLQRLA